MDCPICERDINVLSPRVDELKRRISQMKSQGKLVDDAFLSVPEPTVVWEDGSIVHEQCKYDMDLIRTIDSPETRKLRLQGYRAGVPFPHFMQGLYGLDTPATHSLRVLAHVQAVMSDCQQCWLEGNILPGEVFTLFGGIDPGEQYLRVQDLSFKEILLSYRFNNLGQAVLSYGVTLWASAHKGRSIGRDTPQTMFLENALYIGDWEVEVDHFKKGKRHEAIGHITTPVWDDWNTNSPYQPYREWPSDWKRFQKLLTHSSYLCEENISQCLGRPAPNPGDYQTHLLQPDSIDPIQWAVDIFDALGPPATKSNAPRPPTSGPYWFALVDSKWVERQTKTP